MCDAEPLLRARIIDVPDIQMPSYFLLNRNRSRLSRAAAVAAAAAVAESPSFFFFIIRSLVVGSHLRRGSSRAHAAEAAVVASTPSRLTVDLAR